MTGKELTLQIATILVFMVIVITAFLCATFLFAIRQPGAGTAILILTAFVRLNYSDDKKDDVKK